MLNTSATSASDRRLRVMLAIGSLGGGGSERQMVLLLRKLDRTFFQPFLYLFHDGGPLRDQVPNDVPVAVFDHDHHAPRLNWPGRIHNLQIQAMRKQIQAWEIDCVYDRNFHTTLVTGPATEGLTPRVSTVVSDPDVDLRRQERRFVNLKRARLRRAYQTASAVVAVSEGVRRTLIDKFKVDANRVQTIYSPLDQDRIQALARETPSIRLPADKFHVIGAGRLLEAKGWLDLIAAARQLVIDRGLRQLQFHIMGEGPLRGRLEQEIAAQKLREHVHLLGFQDNPYAILSHANLFCHPSHYEGLPNVILEALACGVPVVATDCRWGPREILDDGRWGLLTPVANPEALAVAIEHSLTGLPNSKSQARTANADSLYTYLQTRFGVEQAIQRVEALMRSVCETDSP